MTDQAPQVLACPHCGNARVVTTQSYVLFNKSAADPNGPIHPATQGTLAHVYACAGCRGFLFWYGGQVVALPSGMAVGTPGDTAGTELRHLVHGLADRLADAHHLAHAVQELLDGTARLG